MIECLDNTIYTGITNNVRRRYDQHRTGKGARYTARKGVKKLLGYKRYDNRPLAMREETRIKQDLNHFQKRLLVKKWGFK
jgi:putative endonuclease